MIERLRTHIASQDFWEEPELRVTFSGGITAHLEGETIEETISRADFQLYEAKTQGRDRMLASQAASPLVPKTEPQPETMLSL